MRERERRVGEGDWRENGISLDGRSTTNSDELSIASDHLSFQYITPIDFLVVNSCC